MTNSREQAVERTSLNFGTLVALGEVPVGGIVHVKAGVDWYHRRREYDFRRDDDTEAGNTRWTLLPWKEDAADDRALEQRVVLLGAGHAMAKQPVAGPPSIRRNMEVGYNVLKTDPVTGEASVGGYLSTGFVLSAVVELPAVSVDSL